MSAAMQTASTSGVVGPAGPATPQPAQIVARYGRLVSSICWRMTRDPERAREAAQEVWLAVLEGLPGFRGQARLSTWIYQIAWRVTQRYTLNERRYSVRFLRAYFSEGEREPPDEPGFDRDLWVRQMCDQCLAGTLQCLEPEARLAFLLRDMAGCDYNEVGAVLEMADGAARQLVCRARRKLAGFLKDQCALHNPDGACRCRMRRHVKAVDLPAEYARLRRTVHQARVYRESEQVLPAKDYWLGLT
jgi:RNA polymerase sigma factor (sigma-70 family)